LHGTDITLVGSDRSFYEITKFSVGASDGVTAVSKFLQKKVRDVFNLDNKIKVIHNFINTDQFTPENSVCPKKTFNADGHKIVMHLSNFRPVKRIQDVMETFNIIHQKVKSKLVMIGEGPELTYAESFVKDHNLTEDVVFMGNQSSVEKILPCADLFLLPTQEESFGLAALEAMSCGVPVIGADSGGLPELVSHTVNGYLYDVGDVKRMGNMGADLLQDEQRLCNMKKAARDTAVNKFAARDIIQQYEDYYFSVITKKDQIK
jgi:N-acetyl-alpha-D-glucosaminyl L-malate synthase BshA